MDSAIVVLDPATGAVREHNPHKPLVYADDLALTRAEGAFETLWLTQGVPRCYAAHLARFRRSAAALELPAPVAEHWTAATALATDMWVGAHPQKDAAVVWTYSRGRLGHPTAWVVAHAVDPEHSRMRREGVAVLTGSRGWLLDHANPSPWLLTGAKTLGYAAAMAAVRYARAHGAQDVIFTAGDRILEGTTSTVVADVDGTLVSPTPGPDVLAGTTQAALFAQAQRAGIPTQLRELKKPELNRARGVWLVSSVRRAVPVTSIDGRTVGAHPAAIDVPGLTTQALSEAASWHAARGVGGV